MLRPTLLCGALAGLLISAAPATAGTVYDNGAPNYVDAAESDADNIFAAGDDFTLAAETTLTDVHFWGLYGSSNTPTVSDAFQLSIYGYENNAPTSTVLYQFAIDPTRTDTGNNIGGGGDTQSSYDVYAYDAVFAPITLAAGQYLLSIVNDTSGATDTWFWASTAGGATDYWIRPHGETDWIGSVGALAFSLTDDEVKMEVPEPATLALFGLGLLGLAGVRRSRAA